jgi:osmotically-inducible protein OsmY
MDERQQGTAETDRTVTAQRSDMELTTAVQASLYADEAIRGQDIDVTVANGVATLSGDVTSQQAEQQALNAARSVDGITRVEDQLAIRIESPGEDDVAATTGADTAAPGWITTKIQAQFFADPDVKPWNIDVTTTAGGAVELAGEVDSAEAKAEAVRIARSTDGVTRVEDHLRVRAQTTEDRAVGRAADTGTAVEDAWITAKIQSKYFLDADVKGRDIDVTTQNGAVTLTGDVESERERRQAMALARNTDGVTQVTDRLQLRPAERTAGDSPREPTATRGTSGNAAADIDDAWITTKVQAQYFLEPDVKGHEINVDTRSGTVTLAGSVESQAARQLAESIARETEGVSRVVNRLTVQAQR